MPRRASLAAAAVVLAGLSLAGCGRTLAIEPVASPDPDCAAVLARVPAELAGQRQREVADPATTAAWGSPPVILRCGVTEPTALEPTSGLVDVDGIAWLPEPLERGTLFTSIGTRPRLEVTVPVEQDPAGPVLVELSLLLRD